MSAAASIENPAFQAPASPTHSSHRPIDLAHLAHQTMGDRALEQEVLGLFIRQARAASASIGTATDEERRRIAHTLKGSARSVGAFGMADCLEHVESGDRQAIVSLRGHIEKVCDFIAAIGR